MALSQGYIETITDLLSPLGRITIRKMFGGAAVYCDGQVFALISDDTLYLKVDETTRADFVAEGCGPFEYAMTDGVHTMHAYHKAPDRLLDETDDLIAWVRKAIAVGLRASKKKTAPARKRKGRR